MKNNIRSIRKKLGINQQRLLMAIKHLKPEDGVHPIQVTLAQSSLSQLENGSPQDITIEKARHIWRALQSEGFTGELKKVFPGIKEEKK